MTDTHVQQRNGLDVADVESTGELIRSQTGPVTAVVRTRHRWDGGAAVEGRCAGIEALGESLERGHHRFRTDLPELLGGRDSGPTPTETVLTACAASARLSPAADSLANPVPIRLSVRRLP